MHRSQQDMELIDILWRQDVDLGAGREVFDSTLSREQDGDEEEQHHKPIKERGKNEASPRKPQQDEETGESVPHPAPGVDASKVNVLSEEDGALSFDECMQLLDNLPLDASPPTVTPDISPSETDSQVFSAKPSTQSPLPDLEHTWMELLSLPELQECPSLPQPSGFISPLLYPQDCLDPKCVMPCPSDPEEPLRNNLNQMTLKAPELNFSDVLFPDTSNMEISESAHHDDSRNISNTLIKTQSEQKHGSDFGLESDHHPDTTEHPDSHSGLSQNVTMTTHPAEVKAFRGINSGPEALDSDATSVDSGSKKTFPLSPPAPSPPTHTQRAKVKQLKTKHAKERRGKLPLSTKKLRASRDEQQARVLCIPIAVDTIVNLPVDEFNDMMSHQQLSDAQLALVRDIRRRGKNKVAAQNCRKRKMESIVHLEQELDVLKDKRERLLLERVENDSSLQWARQQLNSLYREVFGLLSDKAGQPPSPNKYSLQHTSETFFLFPKPKTSGLRNRPSSLSGS